MHKVIALTGGIGTGKSAVAGELANRGFCVWDADVFAREVLFFPEVEARIKAVFGQSVFLHRGVLDRKIIRDIIFSNPTAKKKLEGVLHPAIFELFQSRVSQFKMLAPNAWIFYEASLILELKRQSQFDACVVVVAQEDVKLKRLKDKRNMAKEDALKIMATQLSDEQKIKHAHFVLDNSFSFDKLSQSVDSLLLTLREKFSS